MPGCLLEVKLMSAGLLARPASGTDPDTVLVTMFWGGALAGCYPVCGFKKAYDLVHRDLLLQSLQCSASGIWVLVGC